MKTSTNVEKLVAEVKSAAQRFNNFADFSDFVHKNISWKGIVAKNIFERIISVASAEVNHA